MIEFIAEVSSNHARDLDRSLAFIDAAAEAGCAAVKFQLFKVRELFSAEAFAAKPFLLDREQWELPIEFLPTLAARCRERRVAFSCTPFYLDAVEALAPYVDFYKVASYELLWNDLLAACARTGKRVVLSTGMATLLEVQHAIDVLRSNGCQAPDLLHCTSSYPTPCEEANLAAIHTLRDATGLRVGWSDHTLQPGVIHRAIHRWGATMVEFHLDLDGSGDEYACGHCWLPHQIASVIRDVARAESADGSGRKEPLPIEREERRWRADPQDGLRPLTATRLQLRPAT